MIRPEKAADCGYQLKELAEICAPEGYKLLRVGEIIEKGDLVLRPQLDSREEPHSLKPLTITKVESNLTFAYTYYWFPVQSIRHAVSATHNVRARKLKWWELPRSKQFYTKEEIEELQRLRLEIDKHAFMIPTGRWSIGED